MLDEAGFDAIIGNPPYDVLSSEELGYDVSQDLNFFRSQDAYRPANEGKSNLFKLFICRSYSVAAPGGLLSLIVPMSFLGDEQTSGTRKLLLESAGIEDIEVFPQKDDSRNRIFSEAKLATAIFVARSRPTGRSFNVRTHSGRALDEGSACVRLNADELMQLGTALAIPTCTERDWRIASGILKVGPTQRLRHFCKAFQGEINETTDGKRGLISYRLGDGPAILRGSNICLYAVRRASQGEEMYLREKEYIEQRSGSSKVRHHEERRVGWQESAALNNFRRIIAAPIAEGSYCNHKINYIPQSATKIPLDFLLAVLNSLLSDWFFRLQSTNAAVSHYQVLELPVPEVDEHGPELGNEFEVAVEERHWPDASRLLATRLNAVAVMPHSVVKGISILSRQIQNIEANRALTNRSERSRLAPESQKIQEVIDELICRCFGLSSDDRKYLEGRLSEML